MDVIVTFFVAFFFSFIGTIPPGTINLTIVQMGLDHKVEPAWRFAAASAIVEYLYGWIAVEFESLITASPGITENFELISAVVMLVLGALTLYSAKRPSKLVRRFDESGFRKGIVLGILNPLALPFWVAMTAYIKSQSWISLSSKLELHAYLFGVALGGLALLMIFFYLAKSVVRYFEGNTLLKKIPGITLLTLGAYALVKYLIF
jgi:threonine/homoserine/homoserine lactone efflux protein